jgi:hypothetical protein
MKKTRRKIDAALKAKIASEELRGSGRLAPCSVASEVLGDVGFDLLRGGDIGVGPRRVAVQPPRHAAAVQAERILRIGPQRRVVIGNRQVGLLHLQKGESAVAEARRLIGEEPDRASHCG